MFKSITCIHTIDSLIIHLAKGVSLMLMPCGIILGDSPQIAQSFQLNTTSIQRMETTVISVWQMIQMWQMIQIPL